MASMTIIPQDIITTHILCRLPAKSVGRFRCVSKEWLSLLSEPRFIQIHQKTLNKYHFIFRSNDGSLYSVPYDNHEEVSTLTKLDLGFYRIMSILGSVNGLVLASAYNNLHNNDYYTLFVLNLTTNDYVELPISSKSQFFGISGFGYDSVSDNYKIVTMEFDENVYVYNLRTNTRKQGSHLTYDGYYGSAAGVFVNGFLHWKLDRHSKPVIVAFSLADEMLSELPSPNFCNQATKFVELGEKLAIFNEDKGDVWLMNEYGVEKSWTKIVFHGFNEIPIVTHKVFYDNGKVLFLNSDKLLIYDVEERTFCKSVDISYMNISYFISAFAESLVSPKFSRAK
ncbi:F-box associated interaction domain-containing protein [Artemisia annua]|uniref:F-box associated interaction domain-containing protein n=1 Tax=Artemisia annua TaxID=35608 RepID=A0A2U1PS63_ARTAN|nr:F-box associated interaction domain-containing protein [Artemisia annua]